MKKLLWAGASMGSGDFGRRLQEESQKEDIVELNLSSNQIDVLPPTMSLMTSLCVLVLNFNKLVELPPELFTLVELKHLSVSKNKLRSIPASIGNLTKLELLILSNNELMSLPDEISKLSKLTLLDVSFNKLDRLPWTIGALTALQRLNIEDNLLKAFPYNVGNMSKLTVLRLRNNPLPFNASENASGEENVTSLLFRLISPFACLKACLCFIAIHRFRSDECGVLARVPKDVIKIIVRKVLESKRDRIWLLADPRSKQFEGK